MAGIRVAATSRGGRWMTRAKAFGFLRECLSIHRCPVKFGKGQRRVGLLPLSVLFPISRFKVRGTWICAPGGGREDRGDVRGKSLPLFAFPIPREAFAGQQCSS